MCGICGTVGRADEKELRSMARAMAHRGPDGEGVVIFPGEPPAGLGHRRLAILDPTSAGAQPMAFADRYWITYNGELYNFRELRRELEGEGVRFRTNCDTEVLLAMFATYGPEMLHRLNGIFAFAIWDATEHRLFICRDRLGVKPLYWTRVAEIFAFASELKALLPLVGRAELDPTALVDYLTFLWVPDPKTAFTDVQQLPAGHYAWVDGNKMTIAKYWEFDYHADNLTTDQWQEAVRECVTRSVRRQMVSDVPLGAFLSGGIDSSAVVAAMAQEENHVATYTVGFSQSDLAHEIASDDLQYARLVAQKFETQHSEEILSESVLDLLPKVVWHLEEPIGDPAAISSFLVCRAASSQMPVMLSGMGADEVYAGYPRYLAYAVSRHLDRVPSRLQRILTTAATPLARPGGPGRLRAPRRNLWKFMRASSRTPVDRYLSFCTYYDRSELATTLTDDTLRQVDGYDPLSGHRELMSSGVPVDELTRLLYTDAKTFLPCLNLTYTDKMGMASSVEVRVPLLDDELVAQAARIPSNLKLNGWRRKYIFKRSQEGVLPREVVWRRKAGFSAPIRRWFGRDLAPLARDILFSDHGLASRGFVRKEAIRWMWEENAAGRADFSFRLYALLNLELWSSTFLDRDWTKPTSTSTGPVARQPG